ncbi:glycine--tRNA ligase subunit beta [Siminovitchia acidinfaciens]|uniref:Glycine--tRNA ligase beta subunit n=1 Tax=Siminovitchia acidinfaciens TaxID=2321395 RepID=A0A429XYQ7_9BACI|nr:glycine--tRNA ligase subunit beta [Siminovitchia acidinfaciens]RST73849.1 glycine--tRNA ligase subunit beta [Siminovitchia acidinfaciens]
MSNRDLLLEIGLEEMPARFIRGSINQFEEKIQKWLDEQGIGHGDLFAFSSPRRLAVLVKNVAESQLDTEEEAKGPAKKIALDESGNWSKAAMGFSRSQGMTPDDIYFKEIKGIEYAHIKRFIQGEKTVDLLPQLKTLVEGMSFPNSMRWGSHQLRYLRPIRWLVALFGNEVIHFTVAGASAGNVTMGHRFLGQDVTIDLPQHYEEALKDQFVVADTEKRKQIIASQIADLEKENGWVIPTEDDLLDEVTNLVEYPTAFYGNFDEKFLNLPEEVLITSMKTHQRYFPVKDAQGSLLPYFVSVRNGGDSSIDIVAKGNEKVLRARLADAEFFYEEDQKLEIAEALKKLESIIYHEKIGTLSQKVNRVQKITKELCTLLELSEGQIQMADRAAAISKFDLVTNMVDEFPELQGIMGEKYALQKGEQAEVARAINEHYQPRHAQDEIPESLIGALVGVADKMDTIVTAFAIGLIPTGSHDPYALRRNATGVVNILKGMNWNFSLEDLLNRVIEITKEDVKIENADLKESLQQFFKLRIKHLLQEQNIRYDIIEAVIGGKLHGVPEMIDRAGTLNEHKDEGDFKETVESLARVMNIAQKAEEDSEVKPDAFENKEEEILFEEYKNALAIFTSENSSEARFTALKNLSPAIYAYFDHTMVMAEDNTVRKNRLAQMKKLSDLIGSFAMMNEVQVK